MTSRYLSDLAVPIIGAPMAGGPTTDDLVAAVCEAGAMGFLATAYRSAEHVAASIAELRSRGITSFGANIFTPEPPAARTSDTAGLAAYQRALASYSDRLGVTPAQPPAYSTAEYETMVELLARHHVPWVSFTFGPPDGEAAARLHAADVAIIVTATTVADAQSAVACGADAVWVQGPEAGGHRSTFSVATDPPTQPLLQLLADVRAAVTTPLIASGGVADGSDVARLLNTGADAVGIGTALLRTPEAGTSVPYRRALAAKDRDTVITRAFSGRPARGLRNRFSEKFGAIAPAAFPEVNTVTSPLRQASSAAEDPDGVSLWAGTGYRSARDVPAAQVIADLWHDARPQISAR